MGGTQWAKNYDARLDTLCRSVNWNKHKVPRYVQDQWKYINHIRSQTLKYEKRRRHSEPGLRKPR